MNNLKTENNIEFKGKVTKIIYPLNTENFAIVLVRQKLEDNSATTVKVLGHFTHGQLDIGMEFLFRGYFEKHFKTSTLQFKALSITPLIPNDYDGTLNYLIKYVPHIGVKYAKLILEYTGSNLFEMLEENPDVLYDIEGVPSRCISSLIDIWNKQHIFLKLKIQLITICGFTDAMCDQFIKIYGNDSIRLVDENPYILLKVENASFLKVDRYALTLMGPEDRRRKKATLLFLLNSVITIGGHLYIKYNINEIRKELRTFFRTYNTTYTFSLESDELEEIVNELINENLVHIYLDVNNENCLYSSELYYKEQLAASYLSKYLVDSDKYKDIFQDWDKILDDILESDNITLTDIQKEAISKFMNNPFSILSGLPGTGKSYVVSLILKVCVKMGYNPVILAPTGKVAKHISSISGYPAHTIHKYLGFNGVCWEFDKDKQKKVDILIVDEVSMIDIPLFYQLITGIKETKRILLVGDNEQLPPVGPGNVFKDLIYISNEQLNSFTYLTDIFRQDCDSGIILNSHNISKGKDIMLGYSDFLFCESSDTEFILDKICNVVRSLKQKGYKNIQVLSPTHKTDIGVKSLNEKLQEAFNPFTNIQNDFHLKNNRLFRLYDPIVVTRNNYELDVANGETGKIIQFDKDNLQFHLEMQDGNIVVMSHDDVISSVDLSYCMTIHKAQGSEFDVIIMPFTKLFTIQLNRHLLYTAITRAKKLCVIVGELSAIRTAIKNDRIEPRRHNFLNRLKVYSQMYKKSVNNMLEMV